MTASESTERIRVVILYDRLESVGKAMTAYAHFTRGLECECRPELAVWRLDVATSAEFAVKADYDIACAEIVLMAVRGSEPCPPAFQHWRERAWQDEGAPPRIWIAIVVAAEEPAPVAATWHNALRLSATQIHPEIFVWEPVNEFSVAVPDLPAEPREPAITDAPLAPEIVHADELDHETVSAGPGLVAAHHE